MKKLNLFAFSLSLLAITTVNAQFSDIHDFGSGTDGANPYGSVITDGTKLYGMTNDGGTAGFGVIYSSNMDGSGYSVIHNFTNTTTDGDGPIGSLTLSGGVLYGMAHGGGLYNEGIIFSVNTDGSSFADIHDFSLAASDGRYPTGGTLVISGSAMYGMTTYGGSPDYGIVFSMNINGSGFSDLHQFTGATNDGALPYGSVTLIGSVLYGMTEYGGANNNGMVFSINNDGSGFTDLHDFTGSTTDGSYPIGSLTDNGGVLMGITANGGTSGEGVIFSMNTNGSSFTDLYNFDGYPNGSYPLGQLVISGSTMYGVTNGGGADGEGVLFSVSTSGTSFNKLHDFQFGAGDGYSPYYEQLLLTSNNLYGTTYAGGQNNYGIVFDYNLAYCTLEAVANETTGVSCRGGSNGSATASPALGTPPYSYLWNNAQTNETATGLSAGTYTVTVQDANSCSVTATATITQPTALTVHAGVVNYATCNGLANGKAAATPAGGTSPFTYSWTNAAHAVIATAQSTPATLSAGSYTVTVHDSCGSSASTSVSITQPTGVHSGISSVSEVGCNGGNGGKATATASGGTYPYSYSWSSGSTLATATGLSAGTYTVTVTDKNGCSATNAAPMATITQPAVLSVSLSGPVTEAFCHSGKGSASVTATGGTTPYTYTWTGALSTTASCTKLTAGSYTVTVKDKNGCSATVGLTITQPVAIHDTIVSSSKVNVLCNGSATGSATVGVKLGTAPYTYLWTNGQTNAAATGLSAGIYSVTVTDANGCSSSACPLTITQPGDLRDSIVGSSCNDNYITATLGVKGGVAPYTYAWSPGGGTKATLTNLTVNTYTITVTDKNHCSIVYITSLVCNLPTVKEKDDKNNSGCCAGLDNITIYPNPTSGQFTITVESEKLKVESNTVEIYNMLGQKVYTESSIHGPQSTINISDQPNGIYLIRILDNNGNLVSQKKVVKTN